MKLVSEIVLFSMLITLLFGCQYDGKSNINFEIEIPTKISPNIPLTIKTNFYYDNVEIIIDGEEAPSSLFLDEEGTSSSSFLMGGERGEGALSSISDGPHKINIKFLDDKNRIITEYATNITFDSTPPKPSYLNQELSAGNLNLEYKVDEEDFSTVSLYYNETELASSTSSQDSFSIKMTKDSGIKNYILQFKDNVENTYNHPIEIDTDIDKPPVINSDIIKVNLFSELDMEISDDWDNNFLVLINDGNEVKYPSKLLLKPTTECNRDCF